MVECSDDTDGVWEAGEYDESSDDEKGEDEGHY